MWLGSGSTASKEGDAASSEMPLYAAGVAVATLLFLLLRAHVQRQQHQPHQPPQHPANPPANSCSLVGDCFARSHTHNANATPPPNPSTSSSSFGTRLRQFLAGRPLTLEEQHRRALALARAGNRTGGGGGGSGVGGGDPAMELSFLQLMDRDFDPSDYELLSRLDETVDTSQRFGAMATELELLPLHTVGKEEAAAAAGVGKQQGLGVSTASSLRDASPTCTICLEAWAAGDVQRTLPCLHMFHAACVDPWLRKRAQCPLCATWF